VVWLKCCQRLGYLPKLTEIPVPAVGHVRGELGLYEDTQIARVADRSLRHRKGLVRAGLGLVDGQGHARKVAEEAIRAAAQAKDNPAAIAELHAAIDLMRGQAYVTVSTLLAARCELTTPPG
jgi:transposase